MSTMRTDTSAAPDLTIDLDAPEASAPGVVRVSRVGRLWIVNQDGAGRVGRFDGKAGALAAARARARRGAHPIVVELPDGTIETCRVGGRR
jgi:streptogramin lyase